MELKIGEHALLRYLKLLSRPETQILIFAILFLDFVYILNRFLRVSLGAVPMRSTRNPKESVENVTKLLH